MIHAQLRQTIISLSLLIVGLISILHPARAISSPVISDVPSQLVAQLNEIRTTRHLPALAIDARLSLAAQVKAATLIAEQRFDHVTANGQTPWDFVKAAGYHYELAGENLAMDFSSADQITRAWLISPTHRITMLDPSFTDIGIGTATGSLNGHETTIVVELVGRPDPRSAMERTVATIVERLSDRWND